MQLLNTLSRNTGGVPSNIPLAYNIRCTRTLNNAKHVLHVRPLYPSLRKFT
jgi:hypothetical protein